MEEESRRLSVPLASLYVVAFADSAGGRATAHYGRKLSQRSRSAIVVLGQDDVEHRFCLKAWALHCTTDELIEEIFLTQQEWHPRAFGIDATGTQNLFADALLREAREKRKKLPLVKWQFEGDKDTRIETAIQPLQSAGKLFAMPTMDDLRLEYEGFPGSKHKDILDAMSGALKLLPVKAKPEEARNEVSQYADYLRSQRLPESEIRRRVERELTSTSI